MTKMCCCIIFDKLYFVASFPFPIIFKVKCLVSDSKSTLNGYDCDNMLLN